MSFAASFYQRTLDRMASAMTPACGVLPTGKALDDREEDREGAQGRTSTDPAFQMEYRYRYRWGLRRRREEGSLWCSTNPVRRDLL